MSDHPAIIVTGAARGIGRACAERLAAAGSDILLVDRAADAATAAAIAAIEALGARAVAVAADIGDLEAHAGIVAAAIAAFGRIDGLVNNAGIGAPERGDLVDLKPENFDRVIDVNLRGTVFLTQAVVRRMLADGDRGHPRAIVNITSISAGHASPERIDYCISKAGLAMWSQGLALRLAPEGIAVFDVRPGIIRTDMTAGVAAKYEALIADGLVPARRWGEADDVARAVAGLMSGDFGFATGSVVDLGGGLAVPRL